MRLQGSSRSLFSWRAFSRAANDTDRSIGRLSSGRRVNTSGDDVAGLSISQRVQAQFRGLLRANQNAMEGISLVQTAEASLKEIHDLLQRGRELAVQAANGTLTTSDRASLQTEFSNLLTEIDRVVDETTYNGFQLLSKNRMASAVGQVVSGLRTGWLEQAERLISDVYGLNGDGAQLVVQLSETGTQGAWITGVPDPSSAKLDQLVLHINLSQFTLDSGTSGSLGNDRMIARALTQAILARNVSYLQVDDWFVSGVADYLVGGSEQLAADLAALGNSQQIVDAFNDYFAGTWTDDRLHRSAAYVAVRYLEQQSGQSMTDILNYLETHTLDQTIAWANPLTSTVSDFVLDFMSWGANFIDTQISPTLALADVGAVGGGNAVTVIPDGGAYSVNPLAGFEVIWPELESQVSFTFQVGANLGQTITVSMPDVSTYSLKILGMDLTTQATEAIGRMSNAIVRVTDARAGLGSASNRLEYTIRSNAAAAEAGQSSHSRIVDLDVAREVSNLTRNQIVVSSASAMLAQANTIGQNVNWLLRGLGTSGSSMALGT